MNKTILRMLMIVPILLLSSCDFRYTNFTCDRIHLMDGTKTGTRVKICKYRVCNGGVEYKQTEGSSVIYVTNGMFALIGKGAMCPFCGSESAP